MILSIDIEDFGLFKEFEWSSTIGASNTFKELNIIFGRNYSGKTTLSRIFQCLEKSQLHDDFLPAKFSIKFDNGEKHTSQELMISGFQPEIRVYNTDFIKDNLSWFHTSDGTIAAFTILGSYNINLEREIEQLTDKIGESDESGLQNKLKLTKDTLESTQKKLKAVEEALNDKLRKKAVTIKENTQVFDSPVYSIINIRQDIERSTSQSLLSEEKKSELLLLIKEQQNTIIQPLSIEIPDTKALYNQISKVLTEQITPSEPILQLLNNALLQEWVRKGQRIHKEENLTICAFCGGVLTNELWAKLDKHFDKESEELRKNIAELINSLENEKIYLESIRLPDLPPKVSPLSMRVLRPWESLSPER